MPGYSFRDPTFQKKYIFAFGIEWSSSTITFIPFFSGKVLTSSDFSCGKSAVLKIKNRRITRIILPPDSACKFDVVKIGK
jgi:hypothetical protein